MLSWYRKHVIILSYVFSCKLHTLQKNGVLTYYCLRNVISVKLRIFWSPYRPISKKKKILALFCDFLIIKTHFCIGRHENKENTFSTLVLDLFFPSIANCKKLNIQKIQKSTSPTVHLRISHEYFMKCLASAV
jgi:hypothetical protein